MTKIHGAAEGEVAEEFFYLDDDGSKQDANLHNPILLQEKIDEKIMGPIRDRYRMSYWDERAHAQKRLSWERAKSQAKKLLKDFDPSQPRDEEGQWTSGGGGSSEAPSGVVGYNPGVRGRGMVEVEARRAEWVAASSIKTIDDVIKAAPIAQNSFAASGRRIAVEMGIEFKDPGPKTHHKDGTVNQKGVDRTKQKIEERKGVSARVTDTARGAFILTRPDQADELIRRLAQTHEVLAEPWRTTDQYYTDRALLFRDRETGLIGEVQITEAKMLQVKSKGGGHELYEKARVMPKGPEKDALDDQMRVLYGGVLDSYKGTVWEITDGRQRITIP